MDVESFFGFVDADDAGVGLDIELVCADDGEEVVEVVLAGGFVLISDDQRHACDRDAFGG